MNAENIYLKKRIADLERKLAYYERTSRNSLHLNLQTEHINSVRLPNLPPSIQLDRLATFSLKDDDMDYHLVAEVPPYQAGYYATHKKGMLTLVEIYDILERQLTNMIVEYAMKNRNPK